MTRGKSKTPGTVFVHSVLDNVPVPTADHTTSAQPKPRPSRGRSRAKVNTASYDPHPIVVLGVDTATVSGWAIRVRGRLIASGQIDTRQHGRVAEIVARAVAAGRKYDVRVWVVLERAWGGRLNTIVGLGMARGRWIDACRGMVPSARITSCMPNEWRAGLFGGRWSRVERNEIRAHEVQTAVAETKRDDIGDDEAAAICISAWAARAAKTSGAYKREHSKRTKGGKAKAARPIEAVDVGCARPSDT